MSANAIYIVTTVLLIALTALGFWIARQSLGLGGVKLFQNRQRRIGLVEAAAVDGRRRLLLVRRDNVQHLILTGGPVDVVVETGITPPVHTANSLKDAIHRGEDADSGNARYMADEVPLILHRDQPN